MIPYLKHTVLAFAVAAGSATAMVAASAVNATPSFTNGGDTSPTVAVSAHPKSLDVTWQPLDGADRYRWKIRVGSGAWSEDTYVTTTGATIADLQPSTAYTVAVGARVHDQWQSTWSEVTASTASGHDSVPHRAPEQPPIADSGDGDHTGGGHRGHGGGSTVDWLRLRDDSAVYRDSRTPTRYSFFDPKAMKDPNWGASRIGFFVECDSVGFQQIDPIVSPGADRSAHLHEFFGAPGVGKNLTTQQLVNTPKSEIACTDKNDKSAYWSPAVYQNGNRITATTFKAYYKSPTPNVVPMPLGLRMVAGNAGATSNQAAHIGGWVLEGKGHGTNFNDTNTFGSNTMIQRPNTDINISLRVNYPQCWDGVHLDSPDHQSHMAYASGNGCPESHPVRLPQLVTFTQYDMAGGTGTTLSSGEWFAFHQDFWNGWSPDQMSDLIDVCIRDSMMCRVNSTPHLVELGQYFDNVP